MLLNAARLEADVCMLLIGSASATWLVQVEALKKRSAAVAARIAQKEKDAGSDLDTLKVSLATDLAQALSVPALCTCGPRFASSTLIISCTAASF